LGIEGRAHPPLSAPIVVETTRISGLQWRDYAEHRRPPTKIKHDQDRDRRVAPRIASVTR
jgi:hypothetical protein